MEDFWTRKKQSVFLAKGPMMWVDRETISGMSASYYFHVDFSCPFQVGLGGGGGGVYEATPPALSTCVHVFTQA